VALTLLYNCFKLITLICFFSTCVVCLVFSVDRPVLWGHSPALICEVIVIRLQL